MPSRSQRPLYVGYLPIPRAHLRFLQVALPATLLAMGITGAALVTAQPAWGGGEWMLAEARTWEGVLAAAPYPTLRVADGGDDDGIYLLVGPAKIAPTARSIREGAGIDLAGGPRRVRVEGNLLHRDGRRIISLAVSEADSITDLGEADRRSAPAISPAGAPLTLAGEIMDSKCYLGAMKPGRGPGHAACARLCIAGEIPPALVTRGPDGALAYYLLTDAAGGPIAGAALDALLPLVGRPVEVTGLPGSLESGEGWKTLAIGPGAARPL